MLSSLVLLMACTGDPADEAPRGDPQGLAGGTPVHCDERTRLTGTMVMDGFEKGSIIQIDAIALIDGREKVAASERFKRPGPFRLDIQCRYDEVSLRAYVDIGGDGPSKGDFKFEYEQNPLIIGEDGVYEGITLNLMHPDVEGAMGYAAPPMGDPTADMEKTRVVGKLTAKGFADSSSYVIDVLAVKGDNPQPQVVLHADDLRGAGPFELEVEGRYPEIFLKAYVHGEDSDPSDGDPGAGDYQYDYKGNPVEVGEDGAVTDIDFEIIHPAHREARTGALDGFDLNKRPDGDGEGGGDDGGGE